jgi:hypothetical protein
VFRRFGTRAGTFQALLDDDERDFQQRVLSGPPPLGLGAPPLDRLIAYGRARIDFLIKHREVARAALDGKEPVPAGSQTPVSHAHQATQLTAALDGPLLLYLSSAVLAQTASEVSERLGGGWEDLVRRVTREQQPLARVMPGIALVLCTHLGAGRPGRGVFAPEVTQAKWSSLPDRLPTTSRGGPSLRESIVSRRSVPGRLGTEPHRHVEHPLRGHRFAAAVGGEEAENP